MLLTCLSSSRLLRHSKTKDTSTPEISGSLLFAVILLEDMVVLGLCCGLFWLIEKRGKYEIESRRWVESNGRKRYEEKRRRTRGIGLIYVQNG